MKVMKLWLPLLYAVATAAGSGSAQSSNVLMSVDSIEDRLARQPFEIGSRSDTRFEGDRTQRVLMVFADSVSIPAKWAKAAAGGQAFNNQPRYELAAYQVQKLFLDPEEYVVPPTVIRAMPLDWYRQFDRSARPTFGNTESILVVLQYWLFNVTNDGVWNAARLRSDSLYARHFGNLNVLTYAINHSDANAGNILISQDSLQPRMFSVDNGVAFASEESNRGTEWRLLRTDRLPAGLVHRLREISREDLHAALGVLAQFQIVDRQLVPVSPTENLSPGRGIRRHEDVIQLGLTRREIDGVHSRIQGLLRRVERGNVELFQEEN